MRALSRQSLALALACLLGMGTLAACASSAVTVETSDDNVSYRSGEGANTADGVETDTTDGANGDASEASANGSASGGAHAGTEGDSASDPADGGDGIDGAGEGDTSTADPSASTSAASAALANSTNSNSRGAVNTLSASRNARSWGTSGGQSAGGSSTGSPITPTVPIEQALRPDFSHGPKPAEYQKYIVLHDTEGTGSPYNVIGSWEYDGKYVAAHFIVGRDGQIVQVVPMDQIAHHAGYGDAGHNDLYGTTDESRDDRRGTTSIGDWAPDYGMNSYSIGIEMVHEGGIGQDYPEAQLEALDALIAYIDGYYGFESRIIDHKAWRSYNSDTNPEFATYLANYQATRTHDGR